MVQSPAGNTFSPFYPIFPIFSFSSQKSTHNTVPCSFNDHSPLLSALPGLVFSLPDPLGFLMREPRFCLLLLQPTECPPHCHNQTPSFKFFGPPSLMPEGHLLDPGVYQAALCPGAFAHAILAAWSIGLLCIGLSG